MNSNLPKTVKRYALWLTYPDGYRFLSPSLFCSADEAEELFKSMPAFCRNHGDEEGAKSWESLQHDVVEYFLVEPAKKGCAA